MSVALFVTCLADTLSPNVGRATVSVLEGVGIELAFPEEQTCCGQMHFNTGYRDACVPLVRNFTRVFEPYDAIVTPSGSCAAHVRAHLPELAGTGRETAERTWELSHFLVEHGHGERIHSGFRGSVAYHPTCHSLRLLRLGDLPVSLLRAVSGVDLVELPDADECCGFGGTFAVKNADVSAAMLDAKIDNVLASGAEAVCACDSSCLMHIGGGLRRRGSQVQALHIAEVLAR